MGEMRKLADAVDLPQALADIEQARRRYRAKRLAETGFPATVNCPDCGDQGIDVAGRVCWCAAGRELAEAEARERDWAERMPRRVQGFRLSTAPDAAAASAAREWLALEPWNRGFNLLLSGPAGTGKTGLGVGCLRWAWERDVSIGLVNVAEWVDLMRPTDDPSRQSAQERTTRRAMRSRLLLLDDLGAERPTEWTVSKVYGVVNHRYDAGLATIVTTNATRRDLNAVYGERVIDRLFEGATAVSMAGPNLRRTGGTK